MPPLLILRLNCARGRQTWIIVADSERASEIPCHTIRRRMKWISISRIDERSPVSLKVSFGFQRIPCRCCSNTFDRFLIFHPSQTLLYQNCKRWVERDAVERERTTVKFDRSGNRMKNSISSLRILIISNYLRERAKSNEEIITARNAFPSSTRTSYNKIIDRSTPAVHIFVRSFPGRSLILAVIKSFHGRNDP